MPAVALRLLGPVEVLGRDGAVRPVGPKERCLLAVLAVHHGEVVAEDRLVEALWDGAPPRTAAKTLQNYVLRLRRALDGGGVTIRTRAPGYLLEVPITGDRGTGDPDADVPGIDAALAEARVAAGRRALARGDHAGALDALDGALALWRGPGLEEFADRAFARTAAARLAELRASAAEDRAAAVLALGRHREAVAALETMVADHPLRERGWAQLMLALYRDGRQAEALETHRRLRAVLAGELGVEPGPEVRALHAAVLAHDPALAHSPAPAHDPAPAAAPALGGRGTFVGRERELGALRAHVADAAAGRGGVVLLRGEPGIGKTRLLAELASAAEAGGACVLTGRCPEGGALPFHPFAEALGRHGTDDPAVAALVSAGGPEGAAEALRPDELRTRLLDAVARRVSAMAAAAPLVLLLDDLHWADSGTVAMLRHTARVTARDPVLVVVAYRGEEVDARHPLTDALGALRSEAECRELRLGGIGGAALARLLRDTAGAPVAEELVSAVRAETDGNPFLAREIVRHLHDDGVLRPDGEGRLGTDLPLAAVPEGVRQVVARRRARLPARAGRLLDAAAGIEGPFPFEPVRAVAGLDDAEALAALDDVLGAGLVVPDTRPDRYDFTHALIRHAVHGELNPSRRLRLHRDLAVALDAARAAGVRVAAAEVAAQYHRAAGLPGAEAGVAPALEAAEQARRTGAHDEHAAFLRAALDLLPGSDEREPDLRARLAVALAWALRFDEAVDAARVSGLPAVAAEVASVLAQAGSNRHAWSLAPAALGAVTGPDGPDAVTWASLTLLDLDRREAADPGHPGIPLDLPGRRDALRVLLRSGRLAGRGDLARYAVAAVHGSRAAIPAQAADDPTVAAFLVGDYAAAVPLFERDAAVAEAAGQLALEVYCRAGAARCRVALGDLDGGAEVIDHVHGLVARLPGLGPGWQLLHHEGAQDALAMARDDHWPRRMAAFARWREPAPDRHWGSAAIDAISARGEARMGRAAAALGLLGRPVRALRDGPAWAPNYARTACEVAEVLWLLGRRDHLAVVERALRERVLPADFRFPMTDARQAVARLCALDGRHDEARRWFDAARTVLDGQGALPLRAVVDHDEGLMHARTGDDGRAAPLLDDAAAAFSRLGMPGWARRTAAARR
ncbi:BTAD domain-containing putative transcriptional regulator [Pseudonocardia broussonetiae]|uniref:AAA family ATPase n=1 Tax=Pseudonocardia broussonetiae TaxID=2736640 RepID=A0A6M6JQ48_9PSEU|nr:BTAD domain-containing putative transcriptional regulator [Pseudonocardia broussonetiae]QJY48411.1 AAA family ATPase [Pseudonocardia broussonetiae]